MESRGCRTTLEIVPRTSSSDADSSSHPERAVFRLTVVTLRLLVPPRLRESRSHEVIGRYFSFPKSLGTTTNTTLCPGIGFNRSDNDNDDATSDGLPKFAVRIVRGSIVPVDGATGSPFSSFFRRRDHRKRPSRSLVNPATMSSFPPR